MIFREWTDDRVDELRQLFAAGLSAGEIAERYGVTRNTICGKLNRMGLSRSLDQPPKAKTDPRPLAARLNSKKMGSQVHAINRAKRVVPTPYLCAEVADVTPLRKALLDLEKGDCRWSYDATTQERLKDNVPFRFCGHFALSGSWCDAHRAVVFNTTPKAARAAA